MVYRGKPSAGCENCRKAKKKCTLEQPSCARCVKLRKPCVGYRDTTSLQIQDETTSVKQKAQREKSKPSRSRSPNLSNEVIGLPSPETTSSSSSSSPGSSVLFVGMLDDDENHDSNDSLELLAPDATYGPNNMSLAGSITLRLKPTADEVAMNHFFNQFTSRNHWEFLRSFAPIKADPCLDLAIKACGMAAIGNVENVGIGRKYARSMYAEALGLLNEQLRDPKRCRSDASLIAVSMLGYFENLTCDSRESIQSWKTHIKGATQLLKIRGKEQFKTHIGRIMFREIRAQIMIACLWDDLAPPDFLWDYQPALEVYTEPYDVAKPIDQLTNLVLDFAVIRAKMRTREMPDHIAAEQAANLDRRFIQWSVDTYDYDERWRYYELEVPESEHVWNGTVHAYSCHPAPTAWNTWRNCRIMLSRTQEWLCKGFDFSQAERDEHIAYFRKIRRQLTNDICATIPVQLGHASPAYSSPCVLITAYGSIWPCFFAATCAFERVAAITSPVSSLNDANLPQTSAAAAQALWLISRLDYISQHVGLKWADGVAATLRGDLIIYENQLNEYKINAEAKQLIASKAPWIQDIESVGRGARYLSEAPGLLSGALAEESRRTKGLRGPIWLGKDVLVDRDEQYRMRKVGDVGRTDLPP